MQMEGQIKFFIPQNTSGVSQEKGVAVIPQTIEVKGDQVSNEKNNKNYITEREMPFSCETPAVFCGLKNFAQLSTGMRMSRQCLNFYFWVNYPLHKMKFCYFSLLWPPLWTFLFQ